VKARRNPGQGIQALILIRIAPWFGVEERQDRPDHARPVTDPNKRLEEDGA
jgi:hypothetical protein